MFLQKHLSKTKQKSKEDWPVIIDENMLEVAYGGKLNFVYEHDVYWSFAEKNRIKGL